MEKEHYYRLHSSFIHYTRERERERERETEREREREQKSHPDVAEIVRQDWPYYT